MIHELLVSTRKLTDVELVDRLKGLAARERETTAQLIAHLAELEIRQLHLKAGCGSLFSYCRDVLCLSEHEAYNRIEAAQAARRFPGILDMLADGTINLTTIRLLAPHLTAENHRRVLDSARGKRKAEVAEIVASLAPRPDVPVTLRKQPSRAVAPAPALCPAPEHAPACSVPTTDANPTESPVAIAGTALPPTTTSPGTRRSATTTPLAPDRYRLQVTISGETLEKLELAADMLGHAVPTGDTAEIIDRALTTLLVSLAKKKFASTDRPRPSPGTPDGHSRHIPAEVKRAVWVRDLGRCAYVGAGRRCEERRFLEFDHVVPYAVGGQPTVGNVRLLCRRHNELEARTYFGMLDRYGVGEVRETLPFYPFWNEFTG